MSNWQILLEEISNSNNNILISAHMTTKHRLEAARLFLSILNSTKGQPFIDTVNFLRRAAIESIISNIASALDSLAHEINQIYDFNVAIEKVQIDHFRMQPAKERNCVRCNLDSLDRDDLKGYLNSELPRAPIPKNHWYYIFGRYRQHITHRPWLILHLAAEGIFLPDDPTIPDPTIKPQYDTIAHQIVYPNYTENREVSSYCTLSLEKVIQVVENAYSHLRNSIQNPD